jgi:hypothetical protein
MSVINDTWRFLVQRRLWPVAILLIAAAAAVPTLLAREPEPVPPAPAVAVKSNKGAVLATQPIVAPASDGDRSGRRRVLGARKNPFKPQVTPTPTPRPESATTADTGATADNGTTTGSGGAPLSGASPAPTAGAPVLPGTTVPAKPKKRYELYELTVRFGPSADTRPPRRDVKRLQALPSSEEPVLIYLGVLEDKKTAVFMVDSGVIAQGDGTCRPSRTVCETIHIREGETEFLDVAGEDGDVAGESTGAQYQLDVLKIRKTTTTKASKAKAAKARVSVKGRKILRARIAGDGPLRYRYDKRSGRLEKRSKKAYRSVVAKAAKSARAHF